MGLNQRWWTKQQWASPDKVSSSEEVAERMILLVGPTSSEQCSNSVSTGEVAEQVIILVREHPHMQRDQSLLNLGACHGQYFNQRGQGRTRVIYTSCHNSWNKISAFACPRSFCRRDPKGEQEQYCIVRSSSMRFPLRIGLRLLHHIFQLPLAVDATRVYLQLCACQRYRPLLWAGRMPRPTTNTMPCVILVTMLCDCRLQWMRQFLLLDSLAAALSPPALIETATTSL